MATVNEKMTAIADAIRDKTGETEPLTLDNMATDIPKVYDAGKQSEYDRFWDIYQQNGNRTDYSAAFGGGGWTTELFKPKYPIRPTTASHLFFSNTSAGMRIDDFVVYCEENNIIIDFSNCTSAIYALSTLHSPHFGVLNFSNCTNLSYLFQYNGSSDYGVRTIDKFISSETTKFNTTTFQGSTKLENITFEGVIATGDFDVSRCPNLTHDSLMSIISCLKDISGDGTTKTCTLGTINLAKLSDSEKAIATQKGWTLA